MKDKIVIYFDPKQHKYTDMVGNTYISVTTLIGEYEYKFSDKEAEIAKSCERIGKNPNHPKYSKYVGKTARDLLKEWEEKRLNACAIGNHKHDYLEKAIKFSNNYNTILGNTSSTTQILYSIDDILEEHEYGLVDEAKLLETDIHIKYPIIYNSLLALIKNGYKLYSEIAVFDSDKLVSGLIDLLAIKDKDFIILDWKTNESPIRFEAGYYDKNDEGITTDLFIFKKPDAEDRYFKEPLNHLELSTGNKYTMQLSLYAFLVEQRGYNYKGGIIFHIRHDKYNEYYPEVDKNPSLLGKNVVNTVMVKYLKSDVIKLLNHYEYGRYNGNLRFEFKN